MKMKKKVIAKNDQSDSVRYPPGYQKVKKLLVYKGMASFMDNERLYLHIVTSSGMPWRASNLYN